jgi:hypothetical protein
MEKKKHFRRARYGSFLDENLGIEIPERGNSHSVFQSNKRKVKKRWNSR